MFLVKPLIVCLLNCFLFFCLSSSIEGFTCEKKNSLDFKRLGLFFELGESSEEEQNFLSFKG